ncbi:MAG TPA: HEAT repeat domain-containing protein [Bryobacteraceae bacterium]|jgi:HEAT repeat protein|nr:HEAT repeat domain-containing protein [Bryobacteraceae bacterium]
MVVSLRELLEPCLVSDEEALEIARQRAAQRDAFGLDLARYTGEYLNSPHIAGGVVERSFVLIEAVAQPAQYFWLIRAALVHQVAGVRAAAVALLRRQAKTQGWLEKFASDADENVRTAAMEALWWQTDPEIEQALLAAMQDTSAAVAAAAVYGLYLLDRQRHLDAVQKLAAHRIPVFRSAAAEIIGKLEPADRCQLLKPLLTDADPAVRHTAFQTLTAIKSPVKVAA